MFVLIKEVKEDVAETSKAQLDIDDPVAHRSKPNVEILYTVLQMIAFTCMAILIMRLKLFMTPMMAITTALFANR